MQEVAIYISDLKDEKLKEIAGKLGYTSVDQFIKENNFDVFPLAEILLPDSGDE